MFNHEQPSQFVPLGHSKSLQTLPAPSPYLKGKSLVSKPGSWVCCSQFNLYSTISNGEGKRNGGSHLTWSPCQTLKWLFKLMQGCSTYIKRQRNGSRTNVTHCFWAAFLFLSVFSQRVTRESILLPASRLKLGL